MIIMKITVVFEDISNGFGFLFLVRVIILFGTGFGQWYKGNSLVENGLYDPLFGLVSFGGFVLEKFWFGIVLLTD